MAVSAVKRTASGYLLQFTDDHGRTREVRLDNFEAEILFQQLSAAMEQENA